MQDRTGPVVRISKIFLISVAIAIALAGVTGIVLGLTFKPYRYTGDAEIIHQELGAPREFTPPVHNPYENKLVTDSLRKTVITPSDSARFASMKDSIIEVKGKSLWMIERSTLEYLYYDSIVKARLPRSIFSADSVAETQYSESNLEIDSIARRDWERNRLKDVPSVSEFFDYCDNTDGVVTWTPGSLAEIEASIQSREQYLLAKIRTILLMTFFASFIISYLLLYVRKKRIRVLIN